jgi:hypothetical protein
MYSALFRNRGDPICVSGCDLTAITYFRCLLAGARRAGLELCVREVLPRPAFELTTIVALAGR